MRRLDDFRMRMGLQELVPIMIGGMGVDISTADLALEAARLGGVGHISDAMIKTVSDRRYKTKYVKAKQAQYQYNVSSADKSAVKFNLEHLAEATRLHVENTMSRKQGSGQVFINCMEKLTMNAPKETLRVRMSAALDAGIDGITLAAGLHRLARALAGECPAVGSVLTDLVELAEVVKRDVGGGQCGHGLLAQVVRQVAQHAIPQAFVRHASQLLFDCLD